MSQSFTGMIKLDNIHLELLREQKKALLEAHDSDDSRDKPLLGLVHLIDFIQDAMAEQVGEQAVFGKLD